MEEVSLVTAMPAHAKGIARLYDVVYDGKYPLVEYTREESIKGVLEKNTDVWYVAVDDSSGTVVGSTVGAVASWNKSAELGKTAVYRESTRKGIAKNLCAKVRDCTLERGVEVLWGSLRNDAMRKISEYDGMTVVGYSPGAHRVTDREIHLIGLHLTDNSRKKRVHCKNSSIYGLEGVKEIMSSMRLDNSIGEYPSEGVINPGLDSNVDIKGYFHPNDRSLTLTARDNEHIFAPEYIEATMLVDKVALIEQAQKAGFDLVAFLPAWFEKDGNRFDCVRLAKSFVTPVEQDRKFKSRIYHLKSGFENL